MAATGMPFFIPAIAANGTVASSFKVNGWVPTSAGAPTATRRTFYTDPELATPASNPATLGASGRVFYVNPALSYAFTITDAAEAVTYDTIYNPAELDAAGAAVLTPLIVSNNAALTALTSNTGLVDNGLYQTLGRSSENDGGQGQWLYDSASTSTANSGTILARDGGGAGRFFRLYDAGRVQAEWFGAVVGASAAINTAAINAALAVGPTYLSKAGSYAFGETASTGVAFTMAANYQFYSNSATVTLVAAAGTYTTFNVTGSYTRVIGIQIDNTSKTAGYDHRIVCGSSGSIIETYFDDFLISQSPGVFTDSGSSTGVHYRTYIGAGIGGKATLLRGPGINWSRGWAFLSVGKADRPPDLAFDFTGSSSPNHTVISIAQTGLPAGAGGAYIQASVLGSHGAGATTTTQLPFVFTDVSDLWTAGSTADAGGGNGFLYDGCTHVNPSNSQSSLCDGHGITFDDCAYVRGSNIFIRGRAGVGSPAAAKDGLRFANATTVVALSNVMSIINTGHGCHHTSGSSSEIHISNLISRTNTLRGIKTTSGGVIAFVSGLTNSNTAGNYDLGGALHSIHALVNAAGSQVNLDGTGTG